jgi:hypothetical protein
MRQIHKQIRRRDTVSEDHRMAGLSVRRPSLDAVGELLHSIDVLLTECESITN